jgi:membrane fusion protein (multidrug efflux system)
MTKSIQMMRSKLLHFALTIILFTSCQEETAGISTDTNYIERINYSVLRGETINQEITIPGTVLPSENVELYPEMEGRLKNVFFKEGEFVKKGEPLFSIDSEILEAEKKQVEVNLEFALKDQARKKKLYESQAGTFEAYEEAQSKVKTLNAQLNLLNVQINKATINAPFSGEIGIRNVSEGAFVSTSTLIASISQIDPLKIDFSVPQRYANKVQIGQTVEINISNTDTTLIAIIYATEPVINERTRLLNIRARCNAHPSLSPGSFVKVNYNLGQIPQALTVPSAAIVPVLNGQQIWIMKNGKAHAVPIEIGVRSDSKVQVLSRDLNIGDTVITSGLLGLREGLEVTGKLESL